jgi:hypothetical protein
MQADARITGVVTGGRGPNPDRHSRLAVRHRGVFVRVDEVSHVAVSGGSPIRWALVEPLEIRRLDLGAGFSPRHAAIASHTLQSQRELAGLQPRPNLRQAQRRRPGGDGPGPVALLHHGAVLRRPGKRQDPKNRRVDKLLAVSIPARDPSWGDAFRLRSWDRQDYSSQPDTEGSQLEFPMTYLEGIHIVEQLGHSPPGSPWLISSSGGERVSLPQAERPGVTFNDENPSSRRCVDNARSRRRCDVGFTG